MVLSRVSLPQEFFDIVSSDMLIAPQPQFAFAQMVYASNARAQLSAAGIDMGRAQITQGQGIPSLMDMQLILSQGPFADAVRSVIDLEKPGIGHTVRINRPVLTGGQYSVAARTIASSQSISLTPIDITAEQVSITMLRVVGPASASGSGPAPYAIDRLDATRSVHQLREMVGLNLVYDRNRYLDTVIGLQFDAASNNAVVRPGSLSSDSAFPNSGETALDLDTIFRAEEQLRSTFIPTFSNGCYRLMISPKQARQLKQDPDFRASSVFIESKNPLLAPSVLRVGNIEIIESNTLQTDSSTVAGVVIQRGVMFGPGAVGYGCGGMPEVKSANEDNYGETAKVVWVCYEGHTVLDNRFVVGVRSV